MHHYRIYSTIPIRTQIIPIVRNLTQRDPEVLMFVDQSRLDIDDVDEILGQICTEFNNYNLTVDGNPKWDPRRSFMQRPGWQMVHQITRDGDDYRIYITIETEEPAFPDCWDEIDSDTDSE